VLYKCPIKASWSKAVVEEGYFQEPMKNDKEWGVNRDQGDGWSNRKFHFRQTKFVDRDSSWQNAILHYYQMPMGATKPV